MSYSATLVINGTTYNYPAGPTLPGFSVFFRPDEIVFHWGVTTDKSITPAHLGAYTATIFKDGAPVGPAIEVPKHWWFARWLYEINPDTIIRSPADIISRDLLLPFGKLGGNPPNIGKYQFKGPMDHGGVTQYMGASGERPDIGMIAEWSAHYMLTGDAVPMLEAAKGMRSIPVHLIDERTGKPWDKIKHFDANVYPRASGTWIGPLPAGGEWGWEWAHHPEPSYVAYLATGKLRHLETVQFTANYCFLWSPYTPVPTGYAQCVIGQTRGVAWTMRSLIMAYKATLVAEADGPLPNYLMPSSYWKAILDNQLKFFTHFFMEDPAIQTFRCWPSEARGPIWQQDHVTHVLSLIALWLPEWRPFYLWNLGNLIPRVNGKSGWPRAMPTTYGLVLGPTFKDGTNLIPLTAKAADFFPNWKAALDSFFAKIKAAGTGENMTAAQVDALLADPNGGGKFICWDKYTPLMVRAVLADAVWLDRRKIVDVSAIFPELNESYEVIHAMAMQLEASSPGFIPARISVSLTPRPVTAIPLSRT